MGRKRMISGAELERRIDRYFATCDALNEADGTKKLAKPYALSGMICAIGLTRPEFEKMAANSRYTAIFERALAKIEAFIEESALLGQLSANAAANSLKYNFGWGAPRVLSETPEQGARCIRIMLDEDMMRFAE